jgi:hypothetical protein
MSDASLAQLPLERLAKLVPLLSSDKDGEVVAAARAIGRTLEEHAFPSGRRA